MDEGIPRPYPTMRLLLLSPCPIPENRNSPELECDQTCTAIACPGHIRHIKWRGPAEGVLPAIGMKKCLPV